MITRHQQGFTVVHPIPAFPSPVTPDGTGILGLYPELHTLLSRTQQRMSGRGRAWTLPGLRPWHQPASFDALTHHVRPHVAAIDHHVAGRGTAPAGLGKPGCPLAAPAPPRSRPPRPSTKGPHASPETGRSPASSLPCPRRPMIRSRAAASRAPVAPLRGRSAPPDPAVRSQRPAAIKAREHSEARPKTVNGPSQTPLAVTVAMQVSGRRRCP